MEAFKGFKWIFLIGFSILALSFRSSAENITEPSTSNKSEIAPTAPKESTTITTTPTTTTTTTTSTTTSRPTTASTLISTVAHSTSTTIINSSTTANAATSTTTTTTTTTTVPLTATNTSIPSGISPPTSAFVPNSSSEASSSTESSIKPSSPAAPSTPTETVPIQSSTRPTEPPVTPPVAIIVGVVVGVGGALLLAALIILIVCCCCRKWQFKKVKGSKPVSRATSIRHPVLQARPIKTADFLDYVNHHQGNITSYKVEFDSLPAGNKVGKSVSRATQQQHSHLNRYINILPFNETLVPLNKLDEHQGYINASFVDGYKKPRAYIASQAPVSESLGDFWQMIWEHECDRIIMVTNLFECGRAKCDKYWPNVDDSLSYGSIQVEGIAERSYGDYILRTFRIEKTISTKDRQKSTKSSRKSTSSTEEKQELSERRHVSQFHFTTWPDQGVPSTCSALLKLYRHALKETMPNGGGGGPVVIHCSAGVGRTGTLIAVDISLDQAKDLGTVDIPKCIDTMRRQRMYMVQTVEQYIFIHHVLLEALTLDKVEIDISKFEPIYRQLVEPTLPDGMTRLQREIKILDVLKPRFDRSQFTMAEKYPDKNRSQTLLPADMFLPYVKSEDGLTDIYVNAVHVFGYARKNFDDDDDDEEANDYSYIATQAPMSETIEDFWTMIKETGSSTIVMLNELEGVERYWPEDGRTVEYGSFNITNMGEISSEDIRMTDLQITCKRKTEATDAEPTSSTVARRSTRYDGEMFNIRHFRLLSWPETLPRETTLIALYAEVLRCQERNPNRPVVIQCLHGVDRCGVFCGAMNVLDGIRHDSEVDVFNAVKRIRRTRPEFIEDLSQYKYLYDVAMERIKSSDKADHTAGSIDRIGKRPRVEG